MSQVIESVGTSSTGSTKAVDRSGMSSMSLSLIAWKPRIDEPSKPSPSLTMSSSSVAAGIEKCCQVPGRSQNLTSTTWIPVLFDQVLDPLEVLALRLRPVPAWRLPSSPLPPFQMSRGGQPPALAAGVPHPV